MPIRNPSLVEILDELVSQGFVNRINFTGAGVVASVSGGLATVTIAGGGSVAATTVEVNLGSTPTWRGKFTITDVLIDATKKVLVWQAPGPYTGKGTRADEADMDRISCIAEPLAGSASVYWRSVESYAMTNRPGDFGGQVQTLAPPQDDPQARAGILAVRGMVKGNFKFSYVIFS